MPSTFHPGERAAQARAGVADRADHVGRSIGSTIPAVAARFLTERRMLVVGAADREGRLWATALTGEPGFLRAADASTLAVAARPAPGDPLAEALAAPVEVGTIALDPANRRRMRLNGRATPTADGFTVAAAQVYANCPKYIQRRTPASSPAPPGGARATAGDRLSTGQQLAVSTADTFFVASAGPDGRVDASHRGGNPGFVQVLGPDRLRWPEYAGNAMYNTLGNLELDPSAGLLLPDWETGGSLLLTGRAGVDWSDPKAPAVDYAVDRVVELAPVAALTWSAPEFSPVNPPVARPHHPIRPV
ncbi:pyridoxamine 5'-phosphate oxidase family protein [Kitasatospora sp. NPDC048365]|uniref:pyridoxamine 5'-phosphate oxidase family protein n=1 Tax=Kitasatospora sp. NPDC048365 TaxID=3364050 RepID=UPI00371EA6FF